jgi:ferredoxin
MVVAAQRARARWELHYGGRSRDSMAFLERFARIGAAPTVDGHVVLYPQNEVGLIDLDGALHKPQPETLIYCCGPEQLIGAVEQRCAQWHWPSSALRVERFSPKEQGDAARPGDFEVECSESGNRLTVPPEKSILQVAEEAGIAVQYTCAEGTCGTCETVVLAGEVDHRDSLLTEEERRANDVMFICVSRAASPKLVLKL